MAWDASFKNLLKRFLQSNSTEVITETEVPTANLRIDFVIKHQEQLIPPFDVTDKSIIVGEFKSERDTFNLVELHKSIAKTYLYGTEEDLSDISLYYIIASSSIPQSIQDSYVISTIDKGIYRIEHEIDIIIVLLNDIDYIEDNSFLGLFGGKEIRYKTIKEALTKKQTFIVSIAYFLYKEEVKQVSEAEKIEVDPITLSIRSAVEELGISFVIKEVGLSKVIEEVGLSKVIEEVGLSKVIEEVGLSKVIEEVGLTKLVASLSDKEREELRRLLE